MKKGKNKMLKKSLAIILVLLMTMSMFVACGSDEEAEGGDADVPTYLCLTESTYPPFDTVDDEGNLVGFDFDLIKAIGEDQGFNVEIQDMAFDAIIPAIESGQGDIVTAGMFVTEERAEKVDYCDPYYTADVSIVVLEDNDTITGVESFDSTMKAASQTANIAADTIQAMVDEGNMGEAVILDSFADAFVQLQNHDVDAVFAQSAVANAYVKQKGGVKIVGTAGESKDIAFAVAKGNTELQEKINAGLADLKENGTYDELISKWF